MIMSVRRAYQLKLEEKRKALEAQAAEAALPAKTEEKPLEPIAVAAPEEKPKAKGKK